MGDDKMRAELAERFRDMDDEELTLRYATVDLTPLARQLMAAELQTRGLALPEIALADATGDSGTQHEDFVEIAALLSMTEAHVLRARLEIEGIRAVVADEHLTQAYNIIAPALGGARIRVPVSQREQAREVIARIQAGEYSALLDDAGEVPSLPALPLEQRLLSAFAQDDDYPAAWRGGSPKRLPRPSFNLFACVFGGTWCFFRKLYGLGLVVILLEAALAWGLVAARRHGMLSDTYPLALVYFACLLIAIRLPLSFAANTLYFRQARDAIAQLRARFSDEQTLLAALRKRGGISVGGAIAGIVLHFALDALSRL